MMSKIEISLAGKVVLVTGASSGIGKAIALACADAGADLGIGCATNRPGGEDTVGEIRRLGRRAELLLSDLAQRTAGTDLANAARAAFGRVDVWINNAGEDVLTGDASRLSWTDKLDLLLQVDLRGTVLASWAAADLMRGQERGGTIINMAWDHVLAGMKGPYAEIFCAAKGGVYSFSRALARTVAPHIRVNVLAPGWVETAYGKALDPAIRERITEAIPLKRWGVPQDIASAAVFLSSDDANYITGQMIMINGGDVI